MSSRSPLSSFGFARLRGPIVGVLLGSALLLATGCVPPYMREHLASPAMNGELEEGEMDFQAHVFDSREGSTGGHGSTGGGCGCN